jgi:hypothetical protein
MPDILASCALETTLKSGFFNSWVDNRSTSIRTKAGSSGRSRAVLPRSTAAGFGSERGHGGQRALALV